VIEVRESGIHGRGCFASRDIKEGEVVGCMDTQPATRNGTYVLWVDDEPHRVLCDLRFINHSSEPNCELHIYDEVEVVAIRDISVGEELTWHYGEEFDESISE